MDEIPAPYEPLALFLAQVPDRPGECAELLLGLCMDSSSSFGQVAEAAVAGLDGIGIPDSKSVQLAPEFIENLFSGLRHFKDGTLCGDSAGKIASRPEVFHPVTLVVPALERMHAGELQLPPEVYCGIQQLWTSAAEFLLTRSEAPPPPPDWHLEAKLSCSCADCSELQEFARDPAARVHRFRVKKERRQHLHRTIDAHLLDMTHVTERAGSPQTLVCTKDRRTFKARMKEYRNELAAMSTLVKLAPKSAAAATLSTRMEAAVEVGTI